MSYKIVAYGPGKSGLTWANDDTELRIKIDKLKEEGYTDIRLTQEEE